MSPGAASDAAASAIAAASACSRRWRSAAKCAISSAPSADSHALDAAASRAGMTTMMDDAVAKCRARRDLGRRGSARRRRCGEPMPTFRYRALTQAGEIVSGSLSAPSAAEVARAHRISRPDPDRAGRRAERGASRAPQAFSFFSRPARGGRRRSSPAISRCCCAPARASTTRSNCSPPTPTSAACARPPPALAAAVIVRREFRRGDRPAARGVSADLCRADAGGRGLGHAGADPRSARARSASAPKRCGAASSTRCAIPPSCCWRPAACCSSSSPSCCRSSPMCFATSTPSSIRCWRRSSASPISCAATRRRSGSPALGVIGSRLAGLSRQPATRGAR